MKRRSRKADEAGGYRSIRRMPLRIALVRYEKAKLIGNGFDKFFSAKKHKNISYYF